MKNSNFYLLYGDDKSLLDNEIIKLKKDLGIDGETLSYDIENISDIVLDASSVGLFDLYKFIIVDATNYFMAKRDIDISLLEEYFDNYNVNSYLVFYFYGSQVDSKKKLYKLISSKGSINKIVIDNDYLLGVVNDYISSSLYKMDNDSINYFIERCDNNIDNIKNELDKLMLYKMEDKVITKEDISLLIEENIDDTVFELVNAILQNNSSKGLKLYYKFLNSGMDASQIVAIIASQIRLLFQVKRLYNSGKSNDEIAKILEFKSVYRVKYLLKDCYYYDEEDLIRYLALLADIDRMIKTGMGNGKLILELFITKKDM